MPEYTYRRTDGTTFSIRQKFSDDPLKVDPETGQNVVRLVQAAGIIFKGSGFYVNDSKSASKQSLHTNGSNGGKESSDSKSDGAGTSKTDSANKTETKSEAKTTEAKAETKSSTAAD